MFYHQQSEWLDNAQRLRPRIFTRTVVPAAVVEPYHDETAWQKTSIRVIDIKPSAVFEHSELGTWSWCFDFGEHLTGRLEFALESDRPNDSPVQLSLKFAETPFELAGDFGKYKGTMSQSWLQRELLNFDETPDGIIRLPRRYSFRYLQISGGAPNYRLRLKQLSAVAETSADTDAAVPLPKESGQAILDIDRAALRTLRDCMQHVFEDGPKRDRRLWLGDLWIEARLNAVSFRNFDLVERCLYLFAGTADRDGMIYGAVFDRNPPCPSSSVTTYSLLFAALLRDHLNFTGRTGICRELLPAAERQLELIRPDFDTNGLIRLQQGRWYFIDHEPLLDKEMAVQGLYIYALRAVLELRMNLGMDGAECRNEIETLSDAVRQYRMQQNTKMIVSGPDRQISFASWAWMTIAGVLDRQEAADSWKELKSIPDAIRPRTPYLWGIVLEALYSCGQTEEADALITGYWGGMIARGADTFWEIYVPDDDFAAPSGDCLSNSACHAWSCLAGYFLRIRCGIHPDRPGAAGKSF